MNIKNTVISLYEFKITNKFLELLEIEYEHDYTLTCNLVDIYCQNRQLAYSKYYNSLPKISTSHTIFRPLISDKHANILITMFDILNDSELIYDIVEVNINGKKKYKGIVKSEDSITDIPCTVIAPTIPICKVSIVAALLMDDNDYKYFRKMLKEYLKFTKKSKKGKFIVSYNKNDNNEIEENITFEEDKK